MKTNIKNTIHMRKTIFILSMLAMTVGVIAQTAEPAGMAMVQTLSADVQLSTEQTDALNIAAEHYISAVKTANTKYSDDDKALVAAKAAALQEYNMQLRNILTDEQYSTMRVKQQTKREEINNRIKGGRKQ